MTACLEKGFLPCRGCRRCCVTGFDPWKTACTGCGSIFWRRTRWRWPPTHFANAPGPVKNMSARLSGVILERDSKPRLAKGKRHIPVTSCTMSPAVNRRAGQSAGTLRAMNGFFKMAGLSRMGRVVLAGAEASAALPVKTKKQIRRLVP